MEQPLTQMQHLVGERVQIIAFDTSYVGILTQVDLEMGFLKINAQGDDIMLDLERVDSVFVVH